MLVMDGFGKYTRGDGRGGGERRWGTVEPVLLHDARLETFDAIREVMRSWQKCEKQLIFN